MDALSSSHSLGDSYSQCRAVFPRYVHVHGCYISVHLLPHVCFVCVSYAALRQLADGTEIYLTRLDLQSNGQNSCTPFLLSGML